MTSKFLAITTLAANLIIAAQHLRVDQILTSYTILCLSTTLLLTLLIDPQILYIATLWLRYPFAAQKETIDPSIYWRTIFHFQQRFPELICKFAIVFSLVYWLGIDPRVDTVFVLKMAMGVYLSCVAVFNGSRLPLFIRAVFREILLKLEETGVGLRGECAAVGRILGRNITVIVLVVFAYLVWNGVLISVLATGFGQAVWGKGLLTASSKLMGLADALFDMTDDRIVYKGVVIRYV